MFPSIEYILSQAYNTFGRNVSTQLHYNVNEPSGEYISKSPPLPG